MSNHYTQSKINNNSNQSFNNKNGANQGIPSNNDDFSPPGPPGNPDEWDLQFCKWWGWSWVRKTDHLNPKVARRKPPKPKCRLFSCFRDRYKEREISDIQPLTMCPIQDTKSQQVSLANIRNDPNVGVYDDNHRHECCHSCVQYCQSCCCCCCCCCEQETKPKAKTCECQTTQTPKAVFKTCQCQTERQAKDKCTDCASAPRPPERKRCCCQPVCCRCRCARPSPCCAHTSNSRTVNCQCATSNKTLLKQRNSEKLLKQINYMIDSKLSNAKTANKALGQYYSKYSSDDDKHFSNMGDRKRNISDEEHSNLLTAVCDAILSNKQCELDRKLQNTTRANRRFLTNRVPLRNRSILTKVYKSNVKCKNDESNTNSQTDEAVKQETAERNLETLLKSFNISDFESLDMISPPSSMEEK